MAVVREMQMRDTEEVSCLEQQIFSQPWSRKAFADAINLGSTVFLTAEENHQIIGYIGMYFSLDEGEITNVAVSPAYRNRGIGTMLIDAIKKQAEKLGIAKLVLEVRVSNDTAIRLYEKCKFNNCGIRRGFYEEPKEDAYIMIYGQ